MKRTQWLYEIFTYLLMLLFFYTALNKVMDWNHFVKRMNHQVFNKTVSTALTVFVPLIEFVAVALLISLRTRIQGLWLSFILMLSFSVYVGLALLNVYPRLPCSCAGVFDSMTWAQHFIFNTVFMLIAWIAIKLGRDQKKASESSLAL